MDNLSASLDFDNSINNFLGNIESLRYISPTLGAILVSQKFKNSQEHQQFLKEECQFIEEKSHFLIPPDKIRKNTRLKKAAMNSLRSERIVARNFVVSILSQFDTYLGQLMKCVYKIKPDLIENSERQLTYSQLRNFSGIEDAKDYIIEKEIETLLRESHTEQFRWFEKKLDLKLTKDLPIWKDFIELTQRRNLFVHNDGKVSSQYLNVCKQHGVSTEDLKLGKELKADRDYFENAFNCLFEIGFKLNQVLRRNLLPNELDSADKSFLDITYELIENKQYNLSKVLCDFENKYIKKYSNQDFELRMLLNRAQTYKWLGEDDKCQEIIKTKDWSACGSLFQMTSKILLDDFEGAAKSMRMIGDNDQILNKAFYFDWPIFKEFIKSEFFKDAFKEIYDEDLGAKEKEKVAAEEVSV